MKGLKAEWASLPRRHCDNCDARYKPKRPIGKDQRGFCCSNCRKEFHKYGGSFAKLKPVVIREVTKRIRELAPIDGGRLDRIEARISQLERIAADTAEVHRRSPVMRPFAADHSR